MSCRGCAVMDCSRGITEPAVLVSLPAQWYKAARRFTSPAFHAACSSITSRVGERAHPRGDTRAGALRGAGSIGSGAAPVPRALECGGDHDALTMRGDAARAPPSLDSL